MCASEIAIEDHGSPPIQAPIQHQEYHGDYQDCWHPCRLGGSDSNPLDQPWEVGAAHASRYDAYARSRGYYG